MTHKKLSVTKMLRWLLQSPQPQNIGRQKPDFLAKQILQPFKKHHVSFMQVYTVSTSNNFSFFDRNTKLSGVSLLAHSLKNLLLTFKSEPL